MSFPSSKKPTLYIFSGLPGSGKTTLSQMLAQRRGALYLRIDTVEQGLRDLCDLHVQGEGYRLSYRLAADNLRLGLDVVADSCNSIELTRREWEEVALQAEANFVNLEVLCSDVQEHKARIAGRKATIPGLLLPTWKDIQLREYHSWAREHIQVDTAGKRIDESLEDLCEKLTGWMRQIARIEP